MRGAEWGEGNVNKSKRQQSNGEHRRLAGRGKVENRKGRGGGERQTIKTSTNKRGAWASGPCEICGLGLWGLGAWGDRNVNNQNVKIRGWGADDGDVRGGLSFQRNRCAAVEIEPSGSPLLARRGGATRRDEPEDRPGPTGVSGYRSASVRAALSTLTRLKNGP
jgi:hypothetical protein